MKNKKAGIFSSGLTSFSHLKEIKVSLLYTIRELLSKGFRQSNQNRFIPPPKNKSLWKVGKKKT